ncbi:hypothetical protein O181_065956 [Austropuccinia psidii MF-1]|uniref:Integrase catalytic domain-containing protein n=1 Tax=Austropuccinia psidii MF-1 TaxID=1389203 RepID=A0A9Q3I1Q3_9BASI|nr:hypothetical protein [Austropuccinia psidii MF-1]
MFNTKRFFTSLSNLTGIPVSTGDSNSNVSALGSGTVTLICQRRYLTLTNFLYVPKINSKLIRSLALFNEKAMIKHTCNSFSLETKNQCLLKGTPQHNGFAKRANRTILDKAKCILGGYRLPCRYWAEVINNANFLSNLTPTPSRNNNFPYKLWTGLRPKINHLCSFGCQAFIATPKSHCSWKLAPTRSRGIFLGYEDLDTSYCILLLQDLKVITTKYVSFNEDVLTTIQCEGNKDNKQHKSFKDLSEVVDEAHPDTQEPQDHDMSTVVDEAHMNNAPPEPSDVVYEVHTENDCSDVVDETHPEELLLDVVDETHAEEVQGPDEIVTQQHIKITGPQCHRGSWTENKSGLALRNQELTWRAPKRIKR